MTKLSVYFERDGFGWRWSVCIKHTFIVLRDGWAFTPRGAQRQARRASRAELRDMARTGRLNS